MKLIRSISLGLLSILSYTSHLQGVPCINEITPDFGKTVGGDAITITGTGFTGATAINFGNSSSPSFTVINDGLIQALSPTNAFGVVQVNVTTPDGTSISSPNQLGDSYIYTGDWLEQINSIFFNGSNVSIAPPPPPPPPPPHPPHNRPGLPLPAMASNLGPLADLAGTWVGQGFTLISLPDFSSQSPSTGPKDFRLKLNATFEILDFFPIGGAVPNRGVVSAPGSSTGQPDINLFGLTYLQRVSDFVTNEALHIEPGIWVNIPATTLFPDNPNATVVRMATIPHGDSVLAQSKAILTVPTPLFATLSSTPVKVDGTPFPPGYLDPFINPVLPPGIKLSYVANPNEFLQDGIAGQKIIKTVVLVISTNIPNSTPSVGGILNIPFVTENANATQLDAVFWIETVQQPDGSTFLQLQYTQTVVLNFLGINWPHISVATLIKQ